MKDCFADYLDPKARQGLTYHDISATHRLWAEPGLGVVDLDGVLAALPDDFDGDVMIEVDVPSVQSARESHGIAFEWAQAILDRPCRERAQCEFAVENPPSVPSPSP